MVSDIYIYIMSLVKIFGEKRGVSVFKSSEIEHTTGILYPQNTCSSLIYNLISGLIFVNINDYYYISYVGIITLTLLGIVSFAWWATQLESIQKLDIVLYSSTIVYIGSYFIIVINPEYDLYVSTAFVLLNIMGVMSIDVGNKQLIRSVNILSMLFSGSMVTYVLINNVIDSDLLIYGIILIITGIIMKLCDPYKILPLQIIGTAWFHIFTGGGIYILWESAQLELQNE